MKINDKSYVRVQYKLTEVAPDGSETFVEETTEDRPMDYVHGLGILLPDFEKELSGLDDGDAFDFTLEPEAAYGPIQEQLLMDLDKSIFQDSEGNFDSGFVQVGRYVPMRTADGQTVNGLVLDITEDKVKMDFNHPLSGKTLHFVGHVQEAHPATDQELKRFEQLLHGGCCCGSDEEDCCGHHHDETCHHGRGNDCLCHKSH